MEGYGPSSYGDAFADVYDEWYGSGATGDMDAAVDRLAELAGGGSVLELGVGTGRLAIPLARRGLEVWGVDASPAMLARMRAKPGGELVHAVDGDMSAFDVEGRRFALVFIAFNTFFNLTTADAQARCLGLVRDHLADAGRIVIEAFVPDPQRYPPTGTIDVRLVEADRVVLSVSRAGDEDQVTDGQHVEITERGIRLRPWRIRYLSPNQIDELAVGAGLRLVTRMGGWRGERFDDDSTSHVSVYERPPGRSEPPPGHQAAASSGGAYSSGTHGHGGSSTEHDSCHV
ncbi:MAG: class I SAM-dependent DNA methyltransferase [Acidimicrobiales bacterium]